MYIALIPITFIAKKRVKAVGVTLIVLGFIAMLITNGWGIIPFALLLPAGILGLRYKKPKAKPITTEEEDEGGGEE